MSRGDAIGRQRLLTEETRGAAKISVPKVWNS